MATVNKNFVVKNGVVAGDNIQGSQLVSTTSSLPPLEVTSSATVTNLNADFLDGLDGSEYLDWNNTTNKPDLTLALELGGALVGTGSVTFTDLGNATLVLSDAGVALDGVTLGIETFGDYVESIKPGNSIVISHSSGESASPTISTIQDISQTASPTFGAVYITDTFTIGSASQITNLNAEYLGGYTADQIIGLGGVQSVIGTENEITVSSSIGNIQVGLPENVSIVGSLTVGENLLISGSTVVINSTVVTIEDPVFTLGGVSAGIDDGKDRGIEFKWNDGIDPKVGFFGFDDSTGKFTFIPDASNSSEVFSGTKGEIDASIDWSNLLNVPSYNISLYGDVSGTTSVSNLGSASISVTVEKDFNLVFTGDVSGTGTISDLNSASISLTLNADSIELGVDTTGNYVESIHGTENQVIVSGSGLESASVTLSLPQDIAITSTPTFAGVSVGNGSVSSSSAVISVNSTEVEIDSFNVSQITTAEYLIQAKQGTKMTAARVTVMWDGTDVSVSEYSIIDATAGAANLTFTASENTGTLSLTASSPDAASTNITVKAVRTAIDA